MPFTGASSAFFRGIWSRVQGHNVIQYVSSPWCFKQGQKLAVSSINCTVLNPSLKKILALKNTHFLQHINFQKIQIKKAQHC